MDSAGVTSNALHPGTISSKLLRAAFDMPGESVEKGAETVVYLACSPEVGNISGHYFQDCVVIEPSAKTRDVAVRKKLWEASAASVGM